MLLHTPLTPWAALFGLLGLLADPDAGDAPKDLGAVNAIPVDLIPGGDRRDRTREAPGEEKSATATDEDLEDLLDDLEEEDGDDDEVVTVPKRGETRAPPAEEPSKEKSPPPAKAADPEKPKEGQGGKIRDPVAVIGAAASVADPNAHVRLLLYNRRIRNHPLGKRVGHLLGMANQWKSFFGPAGIDPVQDVDQILIAGPQLRDSSKAVVVLQHRAGGEKIRAAIGNLMKKRKPPGKWEEVNGVSVTQAFADRADRTFLLPSPSVVVLVPPSARDAALKQVRPGMRLPKPKGKEVMTTFVRTPANAMKGIFPVPRSIKWVRMDITTTPEGGAFARLEAEDESPESAKKNAAMLTQKLNAITQVKLGVVGALFGKKEHRVIEPTRFEARGSHIHAVVRATPKQFKLLIEQVAALAEEIAKEAAEKERKRRAAEKKKAEAAAAKKKAEAAAAKKKADAGRAPPSTSAPPPSAR